MTTLRIALSALLLTLLVAVAPAAAQQAPPDQLEAMLQQRDWAVRLYYQQNFPADPRYDDVLQRIAARINPHLDEMFQNSEEQVTYGVFLSDMGFNGVAWHRTVILDSLLLDTLSRVGEGIAVYGRLENPYVDELAAYVGRLGTQGGYGAPLRNPGMVDPGNPYQIPPPPGLTYETEAKGEAYFEEMLAAWVCHEISHCYLGHTKEKIEQERVLYQQYAGKMHPVVAYQQVQAYLNYRLSPMKELEADRAGAELALRAGYSVEGFRNWYRFIDRIEEHTGAAWAPIRTHPPGSERMRAVLEVDERLP